jgi:hypothetical protein
MAARPKDYQELKRENDIRKDNAFPPARTKKSINIPQGSASARHPEILSALTSAVSGYWRNSQFTQDEEYAKVSVSDNINNSSEFANFMNYLSTPEDVNPFKSAEAYGSWSIIPDPEPSTDASLLASVEAPNPQPETAIQPRPEPRGGLFGSIKNRPKPTNPRPTQVVTPPPPIVPTIPFPIRPIDSTISNDGNLFGNITIPEITVPTFYNGGSGGGQKIICNELYRQGFLSEKLWDADERYGEIMFDKNPKLVIGYQMWARRVVKYMRNNPNNTKLAYWLFKPWTEYMGYKMGVIEKPTTIGRLTNWLGTHFSYIVFDLYGGNILLNKYNKVKEGI